MTRRRPRYLLTALLTATLVAVPLRASAHGGSDVHAGVLAEAFVDGQRVVRSSLVVRLVHGPVISADNTALALTHCDGCETVAASLQVVVARGDISDVTLANQAVAVNEGCTDCRALAVARQLVVVTDNDVLDRRVYRDIEDLRRSLRRLVAEPAPLEQLQADIDALMQRVTQSVLDGLREAAPDGARPRERDRRSREDVERSNRPATDHDD
jgi:hypothetical protein